MEQEGFILTRQWQETDSGQDLIFWLSTVSGPVQIRIRDQESVFFIPQTLIQQVDNCLKGKVEYRYTEVQLKDFTNTQVLAFYFKAQKLMNRARSRLEEINIFPLEADLRPTDRYLMERFITGSLSFSGDESSRKDQCPVYLDPDIGPVKYRPYLKILSLDIETSYLDDTLYSIGLSTGTSTGTLEKVFMLGTGESTRDYLEFCESEKEVINRFLSTLEAIDPDILVGWSVVNFDLAFLQRKCDSLRIPFELGRNRETVRWRSVNRGSSDQERSYALVPGRAVLDGIEMLRTATYQFESYSLENVSRQLLGRGKLIEQVDDRAEEIRDLFATNKEQLAAYNLEDCKLVLDIFDTTDLVNFALERTSLTGLDLDRAGGSVAAFDYLYLPRLHRKGRVAPVAKISTGEGSPGGYVLNSMAGLFDHVIVLDFKSLYPSIVRTFNVDPLAMIALSEDEDAIPGFKGAEFSRTEFILPEIIEDLWAARDVAKKLGNDSLSQAIKIIMNSFYGVLGTTGCRFYDSRLVSSITMRGHEILQKTRDLIQDYGYKVIYGDTDSVFVWLDQIESSSEVDEIGADLVEYLNRWWLNHIDSNYSVKSCLEIEFESYFEKFLMPTVRGSDKGSKKRYAGMIRNDNGETELVFKGLETVRSDWTPLARIFQRELYHLIFTDQPFEQYIKDTLSKVISGEKDSELVLRRRLRRPISAYKKNVPPHVRAGRIIEEERAKTGLPPLYERGGWVEYLMTVSGPEPRAYTSSLIDYDFYIDKQLAPVADGIISFKGQTFAQLTDKQMALF